MKPDGLIMRWSPHGPTETMDRLVESVVQNGMTVFARVDHAALAAGVGLQLPPREVLLFGSPRLGTPLMHAAGTLAIDLPLKAMVWQDDTGKTCLAYYDPAWLASRHGLNDEFEAIVAAMKAHVWQVIEGATQSAMTSAGHG